MGIKGGNPKKKQELNKILSGVDQTYGNLPLNLRLEIEKISQGLTEFGPRKLGRFGPGTEFFESREFRPEMDDPRKINARLTARAGRPIVIEKEAEIRQHFYLWRDATGSMNYSSKEDGYTKKQAAEVMLMAFAKHLSKNDELIGVLDGQGTYRGGKAPEWLSPQLVDVTVITGDMPMVGRKLPKNSTAVLFSDFLLDMDELVKGLDRLTGERLKGYLVMVLDPQEIDFDFKGHAEFKGLEGEATESFKRAESMQADYQKKMRDHIDKVERLCLAKGFKFILQRTDQPLHEALMSIYGLKPGGIARSLKPGLNN